MKRKLGKTVPILGMGADTGKASARYQEGSVVVDYDPKQQPIFEEIREVIRALGAQAEDAGIIYIDEVYIGDAVRALDICKPRRPSDYMDLLTLANRKLRKPNIRHHLKPSSTDEESEADNY